MRIFVLLAFATVLGLGSVSCQKKEKEKKQQKKCSKCLVTENI